MNINGRLIYSTIIHCRPNMNHCHLITSCLWTAHLFVFLIRDRQNKSGRWWKRRSVECERLRWEEGEEKKKNAGKSTDSTQSDTSFLSFLCKSPPVVCGWPCEAVCTLSIYIFAVKRWTLCSVAHSVLPSLTGRGERRRKGGREREKKGCDKMWKEERGRSSSRSESKKREREGDSGWWWWWRWGGLESELTG